MFRNLKYKLRNRKIQKFYNKPYSQECWSMNVNFIEFMLPRLEMFIRESDEIIDWNHHKEVDKVDVIDSCIVIMGLFQDYLDNAFEWDVEVQKRIHKGIELAFKKLGEVYGYLWW